MKINSEQVRWYLNHLSTLQHLSGVDGEYEAGQVYKKLLRLEAKASRWNVQECNEPVEEEEVERRDGVVRNAVKKLLPNLPDEQFMYNGDPRGYALKIKADYVKVLRDEHGVHPYQDWGGYGILAPDFK